MSCEVHYKINFDRIRKLESLGPKKEGRTGGGHGSRAEKLTNHEHGD